MGAAPSPTEANPQVMPDWWPEWAGEPVMLVASGPSALGVDIERARGKVRTIAINLSFQLAPWADAIYACDLSFWRFYEGLPEYKGLKLTAARRAAEEYPGVKLVRCRVNDDRLLLDRPGEVGWGGNSGFQALNLAVQFGAPKIILVGFDMQLKNVEDHWHGGYPEGLEGPGPSERGVSYWRRCVDAAANKIDAKVINCSPVSALRNYPKMTLEDALSC